MKILLINKFHFVQGGADRHYLELANLLRDNGHEVIFFSMEHAKNIPCEQSNYFIKYLDFSRVKLDKDFFRKIRRMFWSREAQVKLEELIGQEKPDIAHMHNIYHHISPSIIKVLKKHGIPTVMTVHDYYLVSPLYSLFAKDKIFDPKRCQYWQIVISRAIKDSFGASILSSMVNWWHRHKGYYRQIDLFISPSHFLATRLKQVYPKVKIKVLPNFVKRVNDKLSKPGNYFLFAGRIINEKGVELILRAAKKLPAVEFLIAGTGPDENRLKQEYNLSNVKWLGQLETNELQKKISAAKAVLVPSRWYENCPLAILESFALGVPVIASRMGGMPELIRHEYNGLLFESDNVDNFRKQIEIINNDDNFRDNLAVGAKESSYDYNLTKYYNRLVNLYESI